MSGAFGTRVHGLKATLAIVRCATRRKHTARGERRRTATVHAL
ncbi:hypothetical protein [Paraburkholderia sp.]|nr:hypothetical protein [Paraburkholderia sp.]